jgi:hypothetical protein
VRTIRYPAWQFTVGGLLPGIPEVLDILYQDETMDDTGRMLFFLSKFGFSKDSASTGLSEARRH